MKLPTNVMQWLLAVMALAALGGCGDGPDGQRLHRLLEQRLTDKGQDWDISVNSLQRRGKQAYQFDDSAAEGLVVYYKASLSLSRPVLQTGGASEDQQELHCLARVLGATPQGVAGALNRQSVADEPVIVYGALVFVRQAGLWQPVPQSDKACRSETLAVDTRKALG